MRVYIAGAALLASVWAAPAFAQGRCAQFQVIGNGARTDYNPFDPSGTQDTFDIRVEGLNDGVKRVRFLLVDTTVGVNGPGIGPRGPADYDVRWLEDTTRTVFVVGNDLLNPTNGAEARLPGRRGVDIVRLRLTVPRGQAAPAGQHRENLQIRYQCLDSAGLQIGTQQEEVVPVEVEVEVPRFAAAYIGGIGRTRGTIEFGRIGPETSDLQKRVSVTALSTVPYEVLVETDNDGQLRRQRRDGAGIAYSMAYAGTEVDPGDRIVCPTTPAPMGSVEDFQVTLDRNAVAAVPAGDYSDVVTLTFSPRDVISPIGCIVRR